MAQYGFTQFYTYKSCVIHLHITHTTLIQTQLDAITSLNLIQFNYKCQYIALGGLGFKVVQLEYEANINF
jgi:hypothetical protein